METELRPLTLGEILDRTFQLYRNNFLLFAGIAILAAIVRLFWGAATLFFTHELAAHRNVIGLQIFSATVSILTILVSFVAAGLSFAALTYAVSRIYLAQAVSITGAYRKVGTKVGRYVGLNLAAVSLGWWPAIASLIAFVVLVGLSAKGAAAGPSPQLAIFTGVGALLFLLVIPLCLWLFSRYSLSNAAAISEELTVGAALRRSVLLSKDTRGRIILAFLGILIVQSIMSLIAFAPIFGVLARSAGHPPAWLAGYQLGFGFVVDTLFVPFYGIVLALFYFDARIRKEGFDVDWLLERTGSVVPGAVQGSLPG